MSVHALAGKPAPKDILVDVDALLEAYRSNHPDVSQPAQRVSFGTSGHRGTSFDSSFTEAHILAITQAICDYRKKENISGPLYMGRDTHALSSSAEQSALEVLAANEVQTFIAQGDDATPTPTISHAILTFNRGRTSGQADGIVITPSHNPPADGGFKYNPPHGGPAETGITNWIQDRANELLKGANRDVKRLPAGKTTRSGIIRPYDFITPYVSDLNSVVDMDLIRDAGLALGVDPLGGASLRYWERIAELYRIKLEIVNKAVDPQFSFMTVDHDGKIRMDCSSPYAMAKLVSLRDRFDLAFGNDPDSDRHGIVTKSAGLLNPNHYLAASIFYLFQNRPQWPTSANIGKTLVSSSVIDRVAGKIGRKIFEVPVGFKWFVSGLLEGSLGFGGEESAGASFLRKDGTVWTTDKDGIILDLLACEMTAKLKLDPAQVFEMIVSEVGRPYYQRVDQGITPEEKAGFKNLQPEKMMQGTLAGEKIEAVLTKAPGNGESIGGVKVIAANGWFAARPSGTENVYKLYAESFSGEMKLAEIIGEGQAIVSKALAGK